MSKMTFYDAWWFLCLHPEFNHVKSRKSHVGLPGFFDNLDVEVYKVSPVTGDFLADGESSKGAKTRICLEAGGWQDIRKISKDIRKNFNGILEIRTHDTRLDCGASTYEQAIIKMAKLVKKYYGNYKL